MEFGLCPGTVAKMVRTPNMKLSGRGNKSKVLTPEEEESLTQRYRQKIFLVLPVCTGCPPKKYSLGIKQNFCIEVFELSKFGYFGVLSTSMPLPGV